MCGLLGDDPLIEKIADKPVIAFRKESASLKNRWFFYKLTRDMKGVFRPTLNGYWAAPSGPAMAAVGQKQTYSSRPSNVRFPKIRPCEAKRLMSVWAHDRLFRQCRHRASLIL
jgi:hypothetical protein